MLALIDADIVAFRCAATAEQLEEWIAVARTNELVETILKETAASEYKLYLTGKNNFRKVIFPEYKANRTKPLPKHLQVCRQFLIDKWQAIVTEGCEADDALGIAQSQDDFDNSIERPTTLDTVIVTIDKDLQQIPGKHYHFVKKEMTEVNPKLAMRNFYTQMLVGDPADNVSGAPGIGKAKAPRILEGCEAEEEYFIACRKFFPSAEEMLLNGRLLWIWRQENGDWLNTKYGQLLNEEMH